jgi:S1-C subfamily serine protease
LNRLDLFLVTVLALAAWTGWRRGAVARALSWGGLALGVFLGATLAPTVAAGASDPTGEVTRALLTLVAGGVLGSLAGRFLGRLIRGGTRKTAIGKVDSLLGAGFSVVVVAAIAWFLALNLSNGPHPGVAEAIRGSALLRALDTAMPEPPDLLARVRDLFGWADFPQVFAGFPPEPAGPVDGPTPSDVSRVLAASSGATVKITGRACGRLLQGSGFVVSPNYVLTAAHVVTGVEEVAVLAPGSDPQSGTVVLFDPSLDVAVIGVPTSPSEPLPLAGEEAERGAVGAVVGYPEGGDQAAAGAAVTRVVGARGRDIFGDEQVVRRVYELQTEVVPGNSGGPFVLTDGSVAGMVFASSTAERNLGYAVTAQQLEPDIQRGTTTTEPADTGSCDG